jgi:osmotically-inducible protein OsmY
MDKTRIVEPTPTPTPTPPHESAHRSPAFTRPRRRGAGLVIITALLAAGVGAVLMSNYYDDRPLGARLDASVQAGKDGLNSQVEAVQDAANDAASQAASRVAQASDQVGQAMTDSAITAAVKTALAADPTLSAVKIEVTTDSGIVRIEGPAPDEQSRRRAEILAAAPKGVRSVDNRLVVPVPRPQI